MSNSTTQLDVIQPNSANKEAVANALFDAASPSMLWGRHASACNLLTWGYYGGNFQVGTTSNPIANGTLTLTASTTNYVQADATTGAVTVVTGSFTSGKIPLYTIVTNASTVTSYTDLRSPGTGGGGGSGTVTSVAFTAPAQYSVSGSPITGSGTIALTWANQSANVIFAGPASGGSGVPTFRAMVAADIPVFVASGSSHKAGGVPDPGATSGTTKYLREDATWGVPPGSGGALSGLSDVNVTEGPGIDGYSLVWNNSTTKWIASNIGGGGGGTFAGLSDVSFSGLVNNQLPVYNSTASKWENLSLSLGPSVDDTWNPADCNTGIALSGGDLVATLNTLPGLWALVRGTISHNSGKWCFEWTPSSTSASVQGGGIATTADAVNGSNVPGENDNTGSLLRTDSLCTALTSTVANITQSAGQAHMVAVDIGAGLIWYKNPSSNWNASGTANPATGTGGVSITASLTYLPLFIFAFNSTVGASGSLNVGGSAFINTAPSGFSSWNGADNDGLQPSDAAVSAPASGQVLTYNGSKWANQAPSVVPAPWNEKTANYTAVSGDAVAANTSAGAFTITLPASPAVGNAVTVVDEYQVFDVNALTINPNSSKIGGLSENLVLGKAGQYAVFTYVNSTVGWVMNGGVTPYSGAQFSVTDSFPQFAIGDSGRVGIGYTSSGGAWGTMRSTPGSFRSTGKYYFEFVVGTQSGSCPMVGITQASQSLSTYMGASSAGIGITAGSSGSNLFSNGGSSSETAYSVGDIVGVAVDFTASTGSVQMFKNNAANGSVTSLTLAASCPAFSSNGTCTTTLRTKATQCTYSPPGGYSYWDN